MKNKNQIMKKNVFYLLAIITSFFLYACPSADQTTVEPTSTKCKENLENVTLGVDSTYVLAGANTVTIKLVWDPIPNAQTYNLAIIPGEETYQVSGEETSAEVASSLELNAPFEASLTALMADGSTCGPIFYKSSYCNGGGTVDDVPLAPDWNFICSESSCDFLKFTSRDVKDCDGDLVDPLPWRLRGGTYYKRADVCDCLTNGGTLSVCDGVKDLRLNPCLESLTKCLKHDYIPCGE